MVHDVEKLFEAILGKLETMAKAQTVLGDPIEVAGKTVVPVVRISLGFGAGSGGSEDEKKGKNTGAGGGAGFSIVPVGFILIEADKTAFLPVKPKSVGALVEMIPNIIEKLSKLKEKKGEEEE